MAEYPTDYREISVIVSNAEYRKLRQDSILTGEGTVSAALRARAGMSERAHGLRTAVARYLARNDVERGDAD